MLNLPARKLPSLAVSLFAILAIAFVARGEDATSAPDTGHHANAAPDRANTMDAAFPSSHVEHLRLDGDELAKLGGGSVDKGMTALGKAGYRLFAVTTSGENGASGWHLFKRPRWSIPGPRPRYEYRRIDANDIPALGADGTFEKGMAKLEADNWEIVAFTTKKDGSIGWYFLERPAND